MTHGQIPIPLMDNQALYEDASNQLHTIADFLRFGISEASRQGLFYGHGTDNAEDDISSLIFESLHLPLDCSPVLWHARLLPSEKRLLAERLYSRIVDQVPVPYLTNIAY